MKSNRLFIIHFDDIYLYQTRLRGLCNEIDLRDIRGTRYLCPIERLEELDTKIPYLGNPVVFMGSGDFHYITYLFLRRIKDLFNLILIDKHLDIKKTFDGFISCGSWINDALKLKNLKGILYIGPEKIQDRDRIQKLDDRLWQLKSLIREGYPIYISIDKDILDPSFLKTNWDQGDFTVTYLLETLSNIPKDMIIGTDICGEPKPNPFAIEVKKSEEINLKILNTLTTLDDQEISA